MDFVQMVKQMKPNLRDTSVQAYAVSLKSIAPEGATDLEFLKDTDDVMSKLEKYCITKQLVEFCLHLASPAYT
jgi:hypothetical protein